MHRPRANRPLAWPAAIAAALALPPGLADAAGAPHLGLQLAQAEVAGLREVELAQPSSDSGRLARYEVRLEQLEEQLRQLTGRVEELEFERRQLRELVSALEAQLAAARAGAPVAAATGTEGTEAPAEGPPTPVARPAAAATMPAEPQPEAEPETAAAPAAEGEGTLGTIPQSALLNLPQPEPGTVATPPPRGEVPPQEQYDAAMDLLRAGDYAAAERGLELFLELYPEHPLAANAAYWLAETYYVRKNYAAAAAAFARNYRTYGKGTPKSADNLLKLGMSLDGLGERDKACLSYEELAKEFPNAPAHIQQALARERSRAECV